MRMRLSVPGILRVEAFARARQDIERCPNKECAEGPCPFCRVREGVPHIRTSPFFK